MTGVQTCALPISAFYTDGIGAVAAGYSIRYFIVSLNMDTGINRFAFECRSHIGFTGIGKGTIIFTQMTAKAPLFIYIYSFHCLSFLRFGAGSSFLNRERFTLLIIGINIVAITIPAAP